MVVDVILVKLEVVGFVFELNDSSACVAFFTGVETFATVRTKSFLIRKFPDVLSKFIIKYWEFGGSASLIRHALKLLDSQDTEQDEYEKHEYNCITETGQRSQE